jgi:lipopolysaccharide cholinephosphotransferase
MREDLADNWGIVPLQNKILEIALYIDQLCSENGIDYCLMGGSALGAKRHGGFIPWDDDLDIFMTPDNYNKFRDVFMRNGDTEHFYLQEWGRTDDMIMKSKLRMNNTAYFEPAFANWSIHQGIYVDIFILHSCPDNTLLRLWQYYWTRYALLTSLATKDYQSQTSKAINLVVKLRKLFPNRFLYKFSLKQLYHWRNKKTDYVCHFTGVANYKTGLYKREMFEPTVYEAFENARLRIPAMIHEYLTMRFGDYMTPPPKDMIKRDQHAQTWHTDKDYKEVLDISDLTDENRLL